MFFKEKINESQWQEQNMRIIGLTRVSDTATALDCANELLAASRKSFGKKKTAGQSLPSVISA